MAQSFSQFLQRIGSLLDGSGIPYMAVGSVASMYYGEARVTRDLDIVIAVEANQMPILVGAFSPTEFYVPPTEILADAFANRGMFNLIHQPSQFKIDAVVQKRSPHGVAEFGRRRKVPLLPGLDMWMAAPEDVILKKLVYFREGGSERHVRDIVGMVVRTKLDMGYIEGWVAKLALQDEWAKVAGVRSAHE